MPAEAAQDGRERPSEDGIAPPIGLSLPRHRDLEGRLWQWSNRVRIVLTAVLVIFVVLALLNVFGQRASTASATASGVTLRVDAPSALREGLIYQTRVDITTQRPIARPVITLDGGWLDGMTLNSVQPGPASQTSGHGGATFQYAPLRAGQTLTVWFEWSVNPTHIQWRRPRTITVGDGGTPLVSQTSTMTVFP
ncbi:MAG TPA: hypothetical protein VFH74_05785 [Gaiellales bacterium]|nr:hypothetical protein [Gaiellales bacterium]